MLITLSSTGRQNTVTSTGGGREGAAATWCIQIVDVNIEAGMTGGVPARLSL